MNTGDAVGGGVAAAGAVSTPTMFDYLNPDVNRPDLFAAKAYPIQNMGGGSSSRKRSFQTDRKDDSDHRPLYVTLFYTIGLIVLSALIFITFVSWANVLLSWLDSIYISPIIATATKSRLYYAVIITAISLIVIALLLGLWYYYTIYQDY